MIKAVIFDMDGLMIDSEPLHYKAFNTVCKEYGKELSEEVNNERYVGVSDKDAAEDMVKRYSLPITSEEVVKKAQGYYRDLLVLELHAQPGLFGLLDQLKSHDYKIAIASGSILSEIQLVVSSLSIEKFIDTIVSAQEVKRGKPSPDVFLLAAKRMQVNASECLVLEDAESGLRAAIACGMQCYIIPNTQTKDRKFTGATKVLHSLKEVFENI